MSVPLNQISVVEIVTLGVAAAEGSNPTNVIQVYNYVRGNLTPTPVKSAIEAAFQTNVMASFLAAANVGYTQSWTAIRYPQDPTDNAIQFVEGGVGAITGDRLPTSLAVYVLQRSALRGKSYRGSKHFGPLSESDTTSGAADVLNAAALTRWRAVATAMLASFADAEGIAWYPIIVSRRLSNYAVTPCALVASPVQSVLVNKRIGTMRRRKVKSVY